MISRIVCGDGVRWASSRADDSSGMSLDLSADWNICVGIFPVASSDQRMWSFWSGFLLAENAEVRSGVMVFGLVLILVVMSSWALSLMVPFLWARWLMSCFMVRFVSFGALFSGFALCVSL